MSPQISHHLLVVFTFFNYFASKTCIPVKSLFDAMFNHPTHNIKIKFSSTLVASFATKDSTNYIFSFFLNKRFSSMNNDRTY